MSFSRPELAAFRRADEDFFRRLLHEHDGLVQAWVRPFALDADDQADLAQEVWRRVLQARDAYRNDGAFRGWLYSIARSVCLDDARGRSRRREGDRAYTRDKAELEARRAPPLLTDTVQRAIMELPDRQRETVVARLLDDLNTRETAARMGCAEGTVKAALSQALRTLRARLGEGES